MYMYMLQSFRREQHLDHTEKGLCFDTYPTDRILKGWPQTFFTAPQKTFCMNACTYKVVHACAVAAAMSSMCMLEWRCQFETKFCFKISRAPRAPCRCLPFNFEKMAAMSVTVFEENKVLCRGRLLWVSDVDTSLLSMLQGLLSTSETSESVAGHL